MVERQRQRFDGSLDPPTGQIECRTANDQAERGRRYAPVANDLPRLGERFLCCRRILLGHTAVADLREYIGHAEALVELGEQLETFLKEVARRRMVVLVLGETAHMEQD